MSCMETIAHKNYNDDESGAEQAEKLIAHRYISLPALRNACASFHSQWTVKWPPAPSCFVTVQLQRSCHRNSPLTTSRSCLMVSCTIAHVYLCAPPNYAKRSLYLPAALERQWPLGASISMYVSRNLDYCSVKRPVNVEIETSEITCQMHMQEA